jgi:SAM-dependent methyltransferase
MHIGFAIAGMQTPMPMMCAITSIDGPQPEFRFSDAESGITLPFPDDYFDFIYSNQVLEHVQDLDAACSEISRCLKRDGFSFHVFPSKWQPIECHIHVPFGGAITSDAYFKFWALLGIRNEFQKDKSAAETAAANIRYTRDSLNYKTGAELTALFKRHFGSFEYADVHLLKYSLGKGRWIYPIAKIFPPLLWLYRFAHMRVVLLFNEAGRRESAIS